MEMAGLSAKTREWEKETGEKASIDFVMTMLSSMISEDLDGYIKRVFDEKRQILETADHEARK